MQTSNQHTIKIEQYSKQGELQKTYSPLQNMLKEGEITDFSTSEISYNLKNFVDVETQLSYDDSINLILNNDESAPRIINTQFRKLGNNRYEYLTRNQSVSTNLYDEDNLVSTTDLFLRSNIWPIIDLVKVGESGQLMGGNYVFYIKYCDEDFNESEVVAESGIVSIFKGTLPSTANGALLDERTNKHIELKISNIDNSFKKFYLYYSRDTSDLNGISLTKCYKLSDPMVVSANGTVTITGYENVEEISAETLLIKYNYFTAAKTHAVTQNMLFLGNVKTSEKDYPELQQASYKIGVTLRQKETSIGYITSNYASNYDMSNEYYNPKNIYYYLGYWPDEYYSLGICYILNDGTVTNSFPLYGGSLTLNTLHSSNDGSDNWDDKKYEVNKVLEGFNNTGGIFKLPKIEIINHIKKTVNPLYFEFIFSESALKQLKKLDVIGYFFTRTKRIPTSLFQGFSIGIDETSGIPMPYVSSGSKVGYIAESFLDENKSKDGSGDNDRKLSDSVDNHLRKYDNDVEYHALLSLDPMVNPQLHSMLSWNDYVLEADYKCSLEGNSGRRLYNITSYEKENLPLFNSSLVYIEKETPSFYIDNKYFSTKSGSAETVREIEFLGGADKSKHTEDRIIRGNYCPIIGTNSKLSPSTIYTVKNNIVDDKMWLTTLLQTNNPYFAITNRFRLEDTDAEKVISAYRGDCFTNTVTIRLNRNFIDPTVPSNDLIVDEQTWKNYKGLNKMSDKEDADNSWTNVNLADINTVPLGLWITFKCLSNYNLGLRAEDSSDIDLINKLGSKGSFYPLSGVNAKAGGKVPESQLLNAGYSSTLSRKAYNKWISTPYENWNFENRIAFSNIASTKMFTNGFRVFQGMAYQDVDKQFGQIVKLFPYAQNLLCVFEHGLAIVPINEKALLSTQEGLSIHLYGAGVLQEQVSVISPDYGSTWMESLIKTPNAYYGVDTSAKKIWKFNNTEGFTCISDFKIQSFLNEELIIDWNDKFFVGATNVRTHYNNFKGDVIFTFYKDDKAYSICYNELTKVWVSRYTWMPLLSANIDNHMYSFDRKSVAEYANLYKQTLKTEGIICDDPIYDNGIIFRYNGISNAKLNLSSITYNNELYHKNNNFELIVGNNELQGIYYPEGITELNHSVGSVHTHKTSLSHIPIYANVTDIPVYLFIKSEITSDLIPSKTFVYFKNNILYVTPMSKYEWQSEIPNLEKGWNYIYTRVSLNPKYDSEGNCWFTAEITDGWSDPQKYTGEIKYDNPGNWKTLICEESTIKYEDIPDNDIISSFYRATSKLIDDLEIIDVIPIIYKEPTEADDDIYLYNVILTYDSANDLYKLIAPMNILNKMQVTLQATIENNLLEEHTFVISNKTETSLTLYEHNIDSQITNWYGNQEPFEYEFVVNQPIGMHKIFNDLEIISNNAEPDSIEVEVIGDVYDFKNSIVNPNEKFDIKEINNISIREGKSYITYLKSNKVIGENSFLMHQDCMNIVDFGRRIGNISYIEGKWHAVLQPIYYKNKTSRLRDKWAKIRIKYSGEKLAIITAIQTLMNISY